MIKRKKIQRLPLSEVIENFNTEDYNPIGVIGRHHGKSGEVKVFSYIEDLDLFETYLSNIVTIFDNHTGDIRHLRVESEKYAKENCFYVKFAEINSLSEVESIMNYELYLKNSELPAIENGYYFFEVINSDVILDNEVIGKVVDIIRTGSNDVFEVLQNDGNELLIPVIDQYIKSIDKKSKKIKIVKPIWK